MHATSALLTSLSAYLLVLYSITAATGVTSVRASNRPTYEYSVAYSDNRKDSRVLAVGVTLVGQIIIDSKQSACVTIPTKRLFVLCVTHCFGRAVY
jgi:hypothetical protein